MAVMLQSKLSELLAQMDRMVLSYEAKIEFLEEENERLKAELNKLKENSNVH